MNRPDPKKPWECQHTKTKGSENFMDLNVSFCLDCGTIIISKWDTKIQEFLEVIYLHPWEVWEMYDMVDKLTRSQ